MDVVLSSVSVTPKHRSWTTGGQQQTVLTAIAPKHRCSPTAEAYPSRELPPGCPFPLGVGGRESHPVRPMYTLLEAGSTFQS